MDKLGLIKVKENKAKRTRQPNIITPTLGRDMERTIDHMPDNTSALPIKNALEREPEKDPYMELWEAYQSQLQANASAQKAALQQMYNETTGMLNKNYDNNANYAYINYKQNQKYLPEELSNMGVTGGASESANIKLQNAYGTNLANNEYSRNNDLASARRSLTQDTSYIDGDLNSQLANAYANFGSQSIAYKENQKEKAEAKAKSESIAKKNNDTYSRMAARQKQGYDITTWTDEDGIFHYRLVGNSKEDAKKKQTALDKKNNDTQSRMAKRVKQGYDVYTWTDSSGLFHYRLTGKKKLTSSSSGSGGSGGRSGGSSGGSGGSSNNLPPVKDTKPTAKQTKTFNTLQTNIANYQLRGQTSEAQLDRYTDQIKEYYKSGKITEKQAKSLLKTLR